MLPGDRFIRMSELARITGLHRATIYRRIALGHFPAGRRISDGAVGWLESEITSWMAAPMKWRATDRD